MAKAKTEVMDPKTGEVLPAALLSGMEEDYASGLTQKFDTDDLIIPRINILQDLSPQLKERKPEYVPGAKPGLIHNSVNNALDQAIMFVPAQYHTAWVAWKPRPDGGLVNNNVDPKLLTEENGFHEDGIDRYVGHMRPRQGGDAVKVEVIKTPEWVGIARGADGWTMPVAISFPATKSSAARLINTAINLTEVELPGGKIITPAPFYHTFILSTAIDSSGDNEWWAWNVKHDGYAGTDPRMCDKAREIAKSLKEGRAKVAEHEAN